jgi:hypothetical protein
MIICKPNTSQESSNTGGSSGNTVPALGDLEPIRITDLPESNLTTNLANSLFIFVDLEQNTTHSIRASNMSLGGGGGGGSAGNGVPGGVSTQVQFNKDGLFFGANTITTDGDTYVNVNAGLFIVDTQTLNINTQTVEVKTESLKISSSNSFYYLPVVDGKREQVLLTDGNNQVTWANNTMDIIGMQVFS